MIVIANKAVNTRLGFPHTSATNPTYIEDGHELDIVAKVYGETLEGNNEWYQTIIDEYYWSGGFHTTPEALALPVTQQSTLFDEWRITDFWKKGITGKNTKVAIIDMGFNPKNNAVAHLFGQHNSTQMQFPDTGHGTYMSSIIGGNDAKNGFLGIAPEAEIVIKELNITSNSFRMSALMDLLETLHDFDVISMSFAFTGGLNDTANTITRFNSITNELVTNGKTICIAAAGNEALTAIKYYPAAYNQVNAVAGTDATDNILAGLSNIWPGVQLVAPYRGYFDKVDADRFGKYFNTNKINGTSSATAFTAGIIALIKSYHNQRNLPFTNKDLQDKYLTQTSVHRPDRPDSPFQSNTINKEMFFSLLK
ncbi:subtilisin family serine protease [Chitinophaga sp. W2I13]|uniref:S8 family peptidase n=1 Tax=Chitinophaga sp. W2I13 TaxID=3373923 RepID=UPI003D1E75ED